MSGAKAPYWHSVALSCISDRDVIPPSSFLSVSVYVYSRYNIELGGDMNEVEHTEFILTLDLFFSNRLFSSRCFLLFSSQE